MSRLDCQFLSSRCPVANSCRDIVEAEADTAAGRDCLVAVAAAAVGVVGAGSRNPGFAVTTRTRRLECTAGLLTRQS
jgi:hypothetical protein